MAYWLETMTGVGDEATGNPDAVRSTTSSPEADSACVGSTSLSRSESSATPVAAAFSKMAARLSFSKLACLRPSLVLRDRTAVIAEDPAEGATPRDFLDTESSRTADGVAERAC